MPPILRVALISSAAIMTGAAGWWPLSKDAGPNADLREQVCERLVVLHVMAPSAKSDCLYDKDEFRFHYATALKSRVSQFSISWNRDIDIIRGIGSYLNKDSFEEVSFEQFEASHGGHGKPNFTALLEGTRNNGLNRTSLQITQAQTRETFGQDKANPLGFFSVDTDERKVFDQSVLPMDPDLAVPMDTLMGWECGIIAEIDNGCQGRIYLLNDGGDRNPKLRVAAFDIEPLTDNQVLAIAIGIYAPTHIESDHSIEQDAKKMKRFLADF
ncbi:hypothetical protein ACGYLI_17095 [Sulfitobacter sp. 1A13421]|uniref:hypothetical protein n=1 Tax=Sulfitobacter sp. 1A13421 TaxID=3368595 RepID=UPI00374538B5